MNCYCSSKVCPSSKNASFRVCKNSFSEVSFVNSNAVGWRLQQNLNCGSWILFFMFLSPSATRQGESNGIQTRFRSVRGNSLRRRSSVSPQPCPWTTARDDCGIILKCGSGTHFCADLIAEQIGTTVQVLQMCSSELVQIGDSSLYIALFGSRPTRDPRSNP